MQRIIIYISLLLVLPVCFSGSAWSLDNATTIKGLKEALNVGIKAEVKQTGTEDGFFKNPLIKIELPESLRKAGAALQLISGENLAETLTLKMNRAAEKAAPKALDIFLNAVNDIQFTDAADILHSGEKDAATKYLEKHTAESLKTTFYPIVKNTMEEVDAVKTFNDYIGGMPFNPLGKTADLDINQYVTGKAVDGLFKMVAEQEKKIRTNPAEQVTDILKQVFGVKE